MMFFYMYNMDAIFFKSIRQKDNYLFVFISQARPDAVEMGATA